MQYYSYLVTMNARIDQLVKSLLLKDSLEQCSLYEVEQFAERHPYFGAAQLLLTKKLQTENPARYTEQLQKTNLFFHNPLWVEQLLNDTGNAIIKKAEKVQEAIVVTKTDAAAATGVLPLPVNEEAPVAANNSSIEPSPAPLPDETLHPGTEEINPVTAIHESLVSNIQEAAVDPVILSVADQPAAELTAETGGTTIEEETVTSTPENKEKIAEINAAAADQLEFTPGMPGAITGNELLFEPYHTVDYFASQGIKFREEEVPKDKFSQQLKSFTGWLRTLKKLPVAELTKAPVSFSEHKVEQLAEHSLQEGDIVTEAMAEVWEKQGNKARAIDIYQKLSLLEPAKSTYFAAKIEELKKLN